MADNKRKQIAPSSPAFEELKYRITRDIIEGLSKQRVIHKLKNNGYEMSFKTSDYAENTLSKIYKECHRSLKVENDGKKDELRDIFYERYLGLYNDSLRANDRTNALATLKEMTRMLGLNEPERLDIKEDKRIIIDFGFGNKDGNDSETEPTIN